MAVVVAVQPRAGVAAAKVLQHGPVAALSRVLVQVSIDGRHLGEPQEAVGAGGRRVAGRISPGSGHPGQVSGDHRVPHAEAEERVLQAAASPTNRRCPRLRMGA